jgi:cell fate (sporulation/competence/biofilm development) regulator YlbF (YheA/YmcA/DUF963 family)
MDEVLELAAKLSRALARSKRFTELRAAESAVMADPGAVDLIGKRDELMAAMRNKEDSGAPIEPAEKRALAAADEAVKTNALLANLNRAQADFQEMLYLVNREITTALEPQKEHSAPKSATGDQAGE